MMRLIALGLLVALFAPEAQSQHVILIRHAEKADDGTRNPPLTPEGEARAEALATVTQFAGLDAVYSSPFTRTIDTASPAAAMAGVEVVVVSLDGGMDGHIAAVAASAQAHGAEDRILVVGHSNTIPLIITALGGPELEQIDDAEYNRLFFMDLSAEGAGFREVRFGAPGQTSR